jgi:Fe-S-cluster containining protein
MEKFFCNGCGKCCKKFGEKGLPLFDFEVEKLRKSYKGKEKLDIRPTEIFLDRKSGKRFAVLYGLFNEPCIFLKDDKCQIYNERFLICRSFPIFSTTSFKFNKSIGVPEFMECFSFDCKKKLSNFIGNETKSPSEIENYLKEVYGECFEFAKKSNKESERIMETLLELTREEKIDLQSLDWKSKRNNDNILSFEEFLIKL